MNWNHKKRYRAAVEAVANGLAGSLTPSERAEAEHQATMTSRTPWNGAGISERTRAPHLYCVGGCAVADDPEHPRHAGHQHGCGTHSRRRCGGRYWAGRYGASLVMNTTWTAAIAKKGWTR